jgi:non-ribosomal peptide synthetase component F
VILYITDGRDSPKLAATIGCFASALYLRVELLENDTLDGFASRITEAYCKAHENADSSYWMAQVPSPEFTKNATFNWIPRDSAEHALSADATDDTISCSRMQFDHPMIETLESDRQPGVQFYDTGDEISGSVSYAFNRFSEMTMGRFASSFMLFLETLLNEPEKRVGDIPLL